jgi:hypothetical protein
MTSADYAALITSCAAVALALIGAGAWAVRHVIANDYTVTGSGSFKFSRRAIPAPKTPAPKLIVVSPGDSLIPAQRDGSEGRRM